MQGTLYDKNKRNQWYVDNGCSKHMIEYQNQFLGVKKKEQGMVTFGDDVSSKILGMDTNSFENNNDKAENVLLVENSKPHLLSVR
jgi:hypothetical protein